jgi:hypothetical protein
MSDQDQATILRALGTVEGKLDSTLESIRQHREEALKAFNSIMVSADEDRKRISELEKWQAKLFGAYSAITVATAVVTYLLSTAKH